MPALVALVIAWLFAVPALAAPETVPVRVGDHADFGRIVLDAPAGARLTVQRDGDRVTLRLDGDVVLAAPSRAPRNTTGLETRGATLSFTVPAGARLRQMRLGERIVVDIPDTAPGPPPGPEPVVAEKGARGSPKPDAVRRDLPVPPVPPMAPEAPVAPPSTPSGKTALAASGAASAFAGRKPTDSVPALALSRPVEPPTGQAATAPQPPLPAAPPSREAAPPEPPMAVDAIPAAPRLAVGQEPAAAEARDVALLQPRPRAAPAQMAGGLPATVVVRRASAPDEPGFTLAYGPTTGGAAFLRGALAHVVFDDPRPLDLGALRAEPALAGVTVRVLPAGVLVTVPVPDGRSLALTQGPAGWRIALVSAAPNPEPIVANFADGRIDFPATAQGQVLTLADPTTGTTLLVGTQRRAGQAVTAARRTPEFALVPTLLGVIVEPLSDAVALRGIPAGFQLTGGAGGLAFSPPGGITPAMLAAARLTRRFEFPAMPTEALARRVRAQVREAATMPPLARGPARRIAAESMVALGMGAEADALLRVIAEQDPREAASIATTRLKAVAALLANRPEEARSLASSPADPTDEDTLWRALLLASRQEGSAEAAALLAATASLLVTYPPALRDRFLPVAAETLVLGNELKAAQMLLADRPDDPSLGLARALLRQAKGDTKGALEAYDALGNGRDQLVRARAAVRAVELRLEAGEITPAAAATALEKLLLTWRGDWRDLALRQRVAELRQQAGEWRAALATLREAKADFPAYARQIDERQRSTFGALLGDDVASTLGPLDLIGAVEENSDLLPASTEGDRLRAQLADRLMALDLPKRAEPVLTRLMMSAPTEVGRARFGTTLAALRLREGDHEGALGALGVSAVSKSTAGTDESPEPLPPALRQERALIAAAATARQGNTAGALALLAPLTALPAEEARALILEQARDWAGARAVLGRIVATTVPDGGPLDDPQRRLLLRLATVAAKANDEATLAALRARDAERIGDGPVGDMFRLLTADQVRTASDLARARQEIGLARAATAGLKSLGTPEPAVR